MTDSTTPARGGASSFIPNLRVPFGWTMAGLAAGVMLGIAVQGTAGEAILPVADVVGALWLGALQMTIVPLVAALLVVGIVQAVAAARAGRLALTALASFAAILTLVTVFAAFAVPALLDAFPIPPGAVSALGGAGDTAAAGPVPAIGDFMKSLVPTNIIRASAETAMIGIIVFFSLFAIAITRLPEAHARHLTVLFEAITGAMLTVIGWVLWIAPLGVFALTLTLAGSSGAAVLGALGHYVLIVVAIGTAVLLFAYGLAIVAARQNVMRFARAVLPAQAMAISTQSSLASLPAMLIGCRALGVRETSSELVLPLAVALFRATGPAMNLAVAIYVARLTGVELTPAMLATGVAVALVTTVGSVSLPGAISFITAIGPIALAMGVPIAPLALLVAIEVLPDIMRTLGNVTMDVAVTAAVDRRAGDRAGPDGAAASQP
ncbi:dicarboxylate/amino acid:cation symporter [Qipengyuania sediminis]|uniref:dicarboxylate/amino acid:cation symporter n=1 Tax=Qipengyuania sediminis TaxID=1532023 RepID=UPI001F10B291|nr:cation:dicarboxylase symporter family transporter [Qipengyuania sediminis]